MAKKNKMVKIAKEANDYIDKNYKTEDKEVKMVVIACNTATANSYHIESKLPIIRIIEPTCKRVNEAGGKTAILATNFTVNSKAYNKFLNEEPIGIGCSEWVDIIEAAQTNTKKSKESVERLLAPIKGKVDNIVLGCTHFGLLEDEIVEYLGNVNVINSSTSLVGAIKDCLDEVGYSDNTQTGETIIGVTGDPEKVNIGWFTKEKLDIKKVKFYD